MRFLSSISQKYGIWRLVLLCACFAGSCFGQYTCEVSKWYVVAPPAKDKHGYVIGDQTNDYLVLVYSKGKLVSNYRLDYNGNFTYHVVLQDGKSLVNTDKSDSVGDFLDSLGCTNTATGNESRVGSMLRRKPAAAPRAAATTSPPFAAQAAQSLVTGTFHSPGIVDSASTTSSGVTVNLVNPDGSALATHQYSLPSPVVGQLTAGDFNADGNVDLAVLLKPGASGQGSVAILLGVGDGTFGAPVIFPAGPGPLSIAAGDFNGDGKLDLAVGNSAASGLGGEVDVLLGAGDGTFSAPTAYNVSQQPESILAADFTGDAKLDLAMINSGPGSVDQLQVLIGKGDGTFNPATAIATGSGLGYLSATDLNHDGKLDALIADPASSALVVLFGNGDGTFATPQPYLAAAGSSSVALLPLNDGNTVILLPDNISGRNTLLVADSGGNVEAAPLQSLGMQPSGIAAVDVNGDQKADLVIADKAAASIYVRLNQGNGQFANPVTYPAGSAPGALAIADFNEDGNPDVVAADTTGIDVLLGNGNAGFSTARTFAAGGTLISLAIADFNGDGNPDVAAVNSTTATLAVFFGNGDGTFQPAVAVPLANVPLTVVAGDFNADGKPDLAVSYNQPPPPGVSTITPPGGILILLSNGDGTFSSPTNIPLPGLALPQFTPGGLAAADINADGKLDLVVGFVGKNNNQVAALLGKGDGTFQMAPAANTLTGVATIVVTDIDGDGKPDLVLGDCCGLTEASYLLGVGDGRFQPEVQFSSGPSPTLIAAADLNGDGQPDLAIAGGIQMPQRGTLAIVGNAFTKPQKAAVLSSANSSATAVAPGSLATAYGADLAASTAGGAPLPLPIAFGGTSVLILDAAGIPTPAPLVYVSPGQVNFEVPPTTAVGPAEAVVSSGDGTQSNANIQIADVAPGVFELDSSGLAAAYVILYHQDGTQTVEQVYAVSSSGALVAAPVSLGSSTDQAYLFLFGTGFQAAGTSGVSVTVGGVKIPAEFAGPQGGFIGLDQANILLPSTLAGKGNVPIQLTANGLAANTVNITIQ
jgi:uncharacterized protein (TIGR03437 family)